MTAGTTIRASTASTPMSEAEFMSAVRQLARLRGWRVFHVHDSRRSDAGWPDLAMANARQSRFLVAELKTATGKTTAEQDAWLAALAAAGCETHLWRPADLQHVIPRILAAPQPSKGTAA